MVDYESLPGFLLTQLALCEPRPQGLNQRRSTLIHKDTNTQETAGKANTLQIGSQSFLTPVQINTN